MMNKTNDDLVCVCVCFLLFTTDPSWTCEPVLARATYLIVLWRRRHRGEKPERRRSSAAA